MIKTAVIGVGNIGYHHARNYASFKDVKLVGISDLNEQLGKRVAKQFSTKYYKDYKDLILNENPDAVSISVPTAAHKDVALDVMKLTKNILIEKPIAGNLRDAKRIIHFSKKYNTNLAIGYTERYNPVTAKLEKIIAKKHIGDIISIVIKRVGIFPPNINNADVITDLATHDIDILNYLLKTQPKIVCATGGKMLHNNYDYAELLLDYNGINCFIQVNWITPVKIRTISITGSKGYIEINYISQEIVI